MEDLVLYLIGGIVLLLLTLGTLLVYSGLIESIDVKTGQPPIGKAYVAYKDGTGSYNGVGSYFSESTSIGPSLKQIGIYYDDPAEVPAEKHRWVVGAVLAENDEPVDEALRQAYEREKYKFITLPTVSESVTCVFPYTTMISILIAVNRVYPKLGGYIQRNHLQAYPMIEVYFGGYIHFMAPLSNQMDFFTPKALESETPKAMESETKQADTASQEEEVVNAVEELEITKGASVEMAEKDKESESEETNEAKSADKEMKPEQESVAQESSDDKIEEVEETEGKANESSDNKAEESLDKETEQSTESCEESPEKATAEAETSPDKEVTDVKFSGSEAESDDSFEKVEAEN